ncbi:pentatricopeptide repeat-containing protein At3g47530 [Aristolochia californica]|uniref:pentatricopeptide repeat-containing protein At3g47530 n=1 Tax=Aristolochia californica TaxID=171875 RepID=UPI0035E34BC4
MYIEDRSQTDTCLIQGTAVLIKFLSQSIKLDMNYSLRVFSQISEPNMSVCNAILKEYSQSASPEDAFHFYKLMKRLGIRPSPFSASFVIKACNRMQSVTGARQMHTAILRDGQQYDSLLLTSLMDLYASSGSGKEACILFDEIPYRDTIAWNVLISCYTRDCRTRDALGLFEAMQAPPHGCEPDDVTCLLIIQACSHLGALRFAEQIHSYINKQGYANHLHLCNSLIDMYSKCGCLDKAYGVFKEMDMRNVVTWSAVISGLAMNGYGREAIKAFKEMRQMGVLPDDQTFTGVLSACSHSALVHEGLEFFYLMRSEFGIVPNIHHYGCMVDLLGRAGLLDRAYSLIRSMVAKPDATIWRTLLGACRIHGHVALGERVIGHLIELKAQEAGDYVLLINIYASAGNWDKVAEVRRFMKDKQIQTEPGCSTIEVKGKIHEFVVDDDNHPRKKEIYKMLVEIESQLKIAGYVANVAAELHKAEIVQKESALSYHSEKLAMAFGILATPPGTTLRIAKNLRTCVDCHTFAKVLSSVYNRTVIVRDRTRFHHFQDGSCSCKDYW